MSTENTLKPNCLSFMELLAQNIALISPTMTAALIIPLMFSTSGNISWLSYALGTVMLLFVAFNLNQFAKRSTASGSMYIYTSVGLGPTIGSLSGWCLIWSYLFIGLAGTTGFTIFASKLLAAAGITIPPPLLYMLCLGACFFMAYKDIVISTIVMLILEAVSCAMILGLCAIVLGHHGLTIDPEQFSLKDASFASIGAGVVVAIFSLVGFESSTAFGEEAKKPLQNIPKSIIWSLIITGVFFVLVCYTEVLGTRGNAQTLDKIDAPLSVLSEMYKVPVLSLPLAAGAMFSFFALALSCMNAGARVMFSMGQHGIFIPTVRNAHPVNKTPHIALAIMAMLMLLVLVGFQATLKLEVLDAFNDCGTMGAFGFLGAYILISLAAPFYLKKLGELTTKDLVLAVASLVLLGIPLVGSVYPVPAPPVNYFPYLFLGYLVLGVIRAVGFKLRKPEIIEKISAELKSFHLTPTK